VRPSGALKLLSEVRDLQLVDSEGRKCGIADDIALEGSPGGALRITAILVGPGAWKGRIPGWAYALTRRLVGDRCATVPWSAVDHISSAVHLKRPAKALGLATAEETAGRLVPRFPPW
jgi:hypothetical protein